MNAKLSIVAFLILTLRGFSQTVSYPIVDTEVSDFSDNISVIPVPVENEPFYGQDASYQGSQPSYTDLGNGSVLDLITGLTWEKEMGEKITFVDALAKADTMTLGGYNDWRVPSIKELYSLILFTGRVQGATSIEKFIDSKYFDQPLGNPDLGERDIDAQTWSSTHYVGLTMQGDTTIFGVNFVDGRIKGYPKYRPGSSNAVPRTMYFRMVRGNPDYGINKFVDNQDGTISDEATGLMWQKADDGQLQDWEHSLIYAENLELGGHHDWRLPNAKELQSIVDYTRSPQTTGSPAIDPLFETTGMNDPEGTPGQYPYFWTGTTHQDGPDPYNAAVYIAFGEAQGKMNNNLMDVHGAGAQRSDPKSGELTAFPQYFGPQGDVRYVYNAVRCVRDMDKTGTLTESPAERKMPSVYPNPARDYCIIQTNIEEGTYDVRLFDSTGRLLLRKNHLMANNIPIDLSKLPPGIYLINVDGLLTGKFIKE